MSDLKSFSDRFLGYGSVDAPVWFVGMEEGGGHSKDEIERRLASWDEHERSSVVDIVSFGEVAKIDEHLRWFKGERPPIQSTWGKLIRIQLGRLGLANETEAVREYQKNTFARMDGNECLIELLPLPSPGVGDWHYGEWYDDEWLESRERYRAEILPGRIEIIRTAMDANNPSFVFFYGLSYQPHWEAIAGCSLNSQTLSGNETRFMMLAHPASYGTTNAMFYDVGTKVRNNV